MDASNKQVRSEFLGARITPKEKLVLYQLGQRRGGLSGALRYLIEQHSQATPTNSNRSGNVLADTGAIASHN